MFGFLTLTVLAALVVPALTGGSYQALRRQRWYWQTSFFVAFGLQLVSEHLPHPGGNDLGFGALVASYVLLLGFCGRNLIKTGMAVVAIGIAMNAVAITANHGMPVAVPQRWLDRGGYDATVKHHAGTSEDTLYWLSDVIYLPATNEVISFGDLVLAVGLIDVSFHASRRRRRSALRSRRSGESALRSADSAVMIDITEFGDGSTDPVDAGEQFASDVREEFGANRHEFERVDH